MLVLVPCVGYEELYISIATSADKVEQAQLAISTLCTVREGRNQYEDSVCAANSLSQGD